MLNSSVDNFYLTDDELENSPSRQDGIDAETETALRHYGAELVAKAGLLLDCPQAVMVTGQVLLQRFYCKRSLKEFNIRVS
jgi:cyclin L